MIINWPPNDFTRARIKLTFLYLGITVLLLGLFNGILIYQMNENFLQFGNSISEEKAIKIARSYKPNGTIVQIEKERIHGKNYFDVQFADNTEIAIDMYSGESSLEEDVSKNPAEIFEEFLEKALFIVNITILVISGYLSYFLAGKTLEPIEKKTLQQRRFIANTAYELKDPLAAMSAAAKFTLRKKSIPKKEAREVLNTLLEDITRLSSLTENLLQVFSIEFSAKHFQMIDIARITKRNILKLKPLAKKRNISIKSKLKKFSRMGNEQMIEILVSNLIYNAIRSSHEKGEIIISLDINGELTVQDFGIGISPQHIAHISDPLYEKNRHDHGGSGLGLSIIHEIAKQHDADLIISSNKGKGSLFKVLF